MFAKEFVFYNYFLNPKKQLGYFFPQKIIKIIVQKLISSLFDIKINLKIKDKLSSSRFQVNK